MKIVKKATLGIFTVVAIVGTGAGIFALIASAWANQPRGVRVKLDVD